jgi:DNA-directed RNA polymerase sigma subunit (sigma70/sigma32)
MSNPIQQELRAKLDAPDCPVLSELERTVLTMRWGLQSGEVVSLVDVADALGIDVDNARKNERSALLKIQS